jgi:hypothetical protein
MPHLPRVRVVSRAGCPRGEGNSGSTGRFRWRSLRRRWVDESADSGYAIGRKTDALSVFLDGRLVRRKVNAVNLVAGYIAMEPLDLRAHSLQNADRLLGDFPQLSFGKTSGPRDFAFNHKFEHEHPPMFTDATMQTERLQHGLAEALRDCEMAKTRRTRLLWIFDRFRSR